MATWLAAAVMFHPTGGEGGYGAAAPPSPPSFCAMRGGREAPASSPSILLLDRLVAGKILELRGGGKKQALSNRAERRRRAEAAEYAKLGLDKVKLPPKYKKPPGAHRQQAEATNFEEYARMKGRDKPEWKIAELRLRAQDPEPWKKWRGKLWNFTDDNDHPYGGGRDGLVVGSASEDSDEDQVKEKAQTEKVKSAFEVERRKAMTTEEWIMDMSSLRRVNDGKGNIDFKGVDDVGF